jgi:23S rRNA maturation mini-RNase III
MPDYYASVVAQVRAEAQAEGCNALLEGAFLTDAERVVLKWGRNASGTLPKRLDGMRRDVYRAATAVECLVGISKKCIILAFCVWCAIYMHGHIFQ